ncbi:hypothetical protein BMW23_0602 [Bodo saltans virus]|uniref:Uncharacterized protein n=1 Tax=Bodo saltans virus TaxID=2024608 RepID=A0A2H4UUN0_9VIRU|nr:hypothetical protein QJ851_gp0580 [Bodo saltans virus]YP_010778420.1 hypothetical protein QJ851_gp0581 [Bodo saltans virus]YP_010778421.1 hypothetical protein QJ851_gp0582 [Bodo saltans virus]YP_010778422.1 hypothetical protein QJ851_gp0583 [Bodo saltans virus]YP_010778423.1 hypothetical protein QJ851_gp0584 [Bodo saltans virus]YP_010778424.1 hypothetical protein QJ851_gp0585 [Bodo saltans virus]ATZ80643.1 hypothetical protein BMW23_0597 [Bodo saltans virus]ATZ80644.1 hypothetical protein
MTAWVFYFNILNKFMRMLFHDLVNVYRTLKIFFSYTLKFS